MEILVCLSAALAALYMLAVMPGMFKQKHRKEFTNVYFAHRGLHDNNSEWPENSLAAIKRAADAGYGIEFDVQLTKDKVPVIFHDFSLKRVCGVDAKVSAYTYEELKKFTLYNSSQRIPTLEEALGVVAGRVPLIIEYKAQALDVSVCRISDGILKSYQGAYCIESFNPLALLWYRIHNKKVFRGQLSDAFSKTGEYNGILYWLLENLMFNFLTRPDFVAYNHKYERSLSRRICRNVYNNTSAAWTIKSEKELESAKKHFDIIIFDSFIPRNAG